MKIIETGVLSRGLPGTSRAICTCPTLMMLSNGTLLATYRCGSSKDSPDEVIRLRQSLDGGRAWSEPRDCFPAPTVEGVRGTLRVCYLTELEPGHLLAGAMWMDRKTYPRKSNFNSVTEGSLPMQILLADSYDFGETWTPWRVVPMPAEMGGPPNLSNPVLQLSDGTLAMSVETNKHYHDASKWYQRVTLFHSDDRGLTWRGPTMAGYDPTGRIFNWDQRAAVAPDGRIVAFLWTYDSESRSFLHIHRRLSSDSGKTWSPADDLGFADQPSYPAILADGRVVLAWVDRFKTQSIRARLAPRIDAAFASDTEIVLYAQDAGKAGEADPSGALGLSLWTFGVPYAAALPDGDVLVIYYAGTENAMDIHWSRLAIAPA